MRHSLAVSIASIAEVIPARFEEQVAADPERMAVRTGDKSLSYGALNENANRLARSIVSMTPGNDAVAVMIGQRTTVIAAMLGVLKAGKIFVPLDSRMPPARALRILEDCEARVLLTDQQGLPAARALARPGLQLVDVDALDPALPCDNLGLPIEGDGPACLMYTSGSTGAPKGVIQTHRNLLYRTETYTELLQVRPHDRLTMLAPCSVAQGLSSALQALLNGASLHPFDLHGLGVGELAPWLIAHGITVFVSTTSTFRHFARTLTPVDEFPALRIIRLGSGQIAAEDFRLFCRHFPRHCVLVGTFGSTEAGPITAVVMDHDSHIADVAPAGYPVDDTRVLILDNAGRVRQAGTLGEIAVQSRFLSPGYWRDPERTAAAFVETPGARGERFYRTGDLGILRPDGCLEFRGRKDFRVKIRGYRVELEEIERSLCAHPLVAEAAVMAWPDGTDDSRLAAYVVPRMGTSPATEDLRAHLRSSLPEHMALPSFEFLTALPRTASGKVDRASLPPPSAPTTAAATVASRKPSDMVESRLTSLWEDLLEQRPIDVAANFFDLGGHSLLAARLSTSIERAFGAKLPLSAFIDAATIEQQARLIRNHARNTPWPSLVPLRSSGSRPPLFCMHMREGDVLSYRDLARHLPSDQPLYGLQSRGLDGLGPINTRIEDMARDYVAEIRKLYPRGPYALCGWSFGGVVAFEVARQLEQKGQVVALLAVFDSKTPRGRRSRALLRRELRRAPTHVSALLHGRDRRAYLRRKLHTARRLLETPLWRMLVHWHRCGAWLPRALRNVEHANKVALRDYVPGVYGGRMTLFRIARRGQYDPFLGWQGLAAGGIETHEVPGTHLTMVFEPHVRVLAEKLSRVLDETWAGAARV